MEFTFLHVIVVDSVMGSYSAWMSCACKSATAPASAAEAGATAGTIATSRRTTRSVPVLPRWSIPDITREFHFHGL